MSMFWIREAVDALGAQLLGKDVHVAGVCTDTRALAAGDLFVALRGERFDGHAFLAQAASAGAAAALVDAAFLAGTARPDDGLPLLVVADTRLALGQLAGWWRTRLRAPVIGITGSNGKTTVKEMVAAICVAATGNPETVLATKGNLNNDIGMPLTLLGARASHRFVVLEMGMNHAGEIRYLSQVARPDVVVVNNAGTAHLEGLGSVEAIARAKGEIFEGLATNGTAVFNADDAFAPLWQDLSASAAHRLTFGLGPAEVRGKDCGAGRVAITTPAGAVEVQLNLLGEHNVKNALAATAVSCALGLPLSLVQQGLGGFAGVKGRLQKKVARGGALLLDDTYNANPASVRAAIDVLAGQPGRRVLVLGDMGELGSDGEALHAEVGRYARDKSIDALYGLGSLSQAAVTCFGGSALHYGSAEALVAALAEKELAKPAAPLTILVKGSRFMKMERVVEALQETA